MGAEVLELLRDGMASEDIAVLVRSGADLFAQVFESYGIPVARERRTPFAQTRLGTGVLAFARAALGRHGAWTSSPGCARPASSRPPPRRPSSPTGSRSRSAATRRAPPATRAGTGRKLGGRELTELDELRRRMRRNRS